MSFFKIRPESIRLDAATACQLQCPSCSTGKGKNKDSIIGSGFLSKENFLKLLSENPWIKSIELSNWGEIFLNKDIAEIFKIGFERNVVLTAKNGVNLNTCEEKALEACVKYKMAAMTCSIDGASNQSYAKYRIGGKFETVIKNIKKINHYKKIYDSSYPVLTWQFVIFGHNEHELPLGQKMAEELNMNFRAKLSWDEEFSPVKDKSISLAWAGAESRSAFRRQNGTDYKRDVCHQLWLQPQINFDGKLLGCCVNKWLEFGNVFEEGIIRAFNNSKIRYARKMLMGKARAKGKIPCTHCPKYHKMRDSSRWITRAELGLVSLFSIGGLRGLWTGWRRGVDTIRAFLVTL